MRIKPLRIIAMLLAAIMCGCSDGHKNKAIPRREAYPRLEQYAPQYTDIRIGQFSVPVNSSAIVDSITPEWTNVEYPRYGLTLHLTALKTPSETELANAVDNRLERMALNIGDKNAADTSFITSAGLECVVVVSRDGIPTPIQFIAVESSGGILSGTVALKGKATPTDSIAPIIDAMAAEIDTLLRRTCLQ